MSIKQFLLGINERRVVFLQERRDRRISQLVDVSVGDIMMDWGEFDYVQFIIASRLLDIEAYYSGDSSFKYQRALAECMYPFRQYDAKKLDAQFVKLIKSYEKRGFDETSPVKIDKNKRLRNGTHRCALNIYHGISEIRSLVLPYCFELQDYKSMIDNTLDIDLKNDILCKLTSVRSELVLSGDCFAGFAPCAIALEQLPKDFIIHNSINYQTSESHFFSGNEIPHQGIYFQFDVHAPEYEVVDKRLYSMKVVKLLNNSREFIISRNCTEGRMLHSLANSIL